jgi:hypothetical protein
MWQCDLRQSLPSANIEGMRERMDAHIGLMNANIGVQYTEESLHIAKRTLHDYDLIPHLHAGAAHGRIYFMFLEIIANFELLQHTLQAKNVRTLHMDVGAGGIIDAVLKYAPHADWHATSRSPDVYQHIRTAKKINGHARFLHDNIAQEVENAMLITCSSSDLDHAISLLHENGVLLMFCDNVFDDSIGVVLNNFENVHMCKPLIMAPSAPGCIVIAHQKQRSNCIPNAWAHAARQLAEQEYIGRCKAMQLAMYLTNIDIKTTTATQKFYLDYVASSPSRMEKAQRVLNSISA